jgi:hypothetical protein
MEFGIFNYELFNLLSPSAVERAETKSLASVFLEDGEPSFRLTRSNYSSTMELLIYEFLITFPFLLSFLFVLKLSIESSKGIYSIFIMAFPFWTTNIISNDYLALSTINKFCRYINLGDLIAVLGSIDFVLGSIDL